MLPVGRSVLVQDAHVLNTCVPYSGRLQFGGRNSKEWWHVREGRQNSLEGEVMAVLWEADEPLNPREVKGRLRRELAYTSVMTTLVRLANKGMVTRVKIGKAFAYSAVQRAEDHAAQTMRDVLAGGVNPIGVLSRFVERLNPEEEAALRSFLDDPGSRDG
jgi:predicted transcriptional regulator